MNTANKDSSNALNNFDLLATEAPIYGSSRVAVWNKSDVAEDNKNDLSVFNRLLYNTRGHKFYDMRAFANAKKKSKIIGKYRITWAMC